MHKNIFLKFLFVSSQTKVASDKQAITALTSNIIWEAQINELTYHMEMKFNLFVICLFHRILLMWTTCWLYSIYCLIHTDTLVGRSFCHCQHSDSSIRVRPILCQDIKKGNMLVCCWYLMTLNSLKNYCKL